MTTETTETAVETVGRVFARVKKIEQDMGFEDFDALPIASRRFLANYGWKQWAADAHAGDKRDSFPTGAAGTEAWAQKVLEHVRERHAAIVTGLGLPGTPKVDVNAETVRKLAAAEAANANLAAQMAAAMARIAELESPRKKAA